MKLSVIIVNYNVRYFLEQALQSVYKAIPLMEGAYGKGCTDIYVVDNNSGDGSVEMVEAHFPQVKLIANKVNTGFSKANNQAIKDSDAEYVLLLNPDTVIQEETLLNTVAFMDSHTDAGGLGINMIDGAGHFLPESKRGFPSPAVAFYKISGLSRIFPKSKKLGRYHLGFLDKKEIHEVDVLAGAFMLLRKKVLDDIGLLDETFFMYGEDIDLSYRIVKAGYKNYYYPDAAIVHYKGESTKKSSVNYVFVFYKAMVIFARKHLPPHTASTFAMLINVAIWLRAGLAIVFRFLRLLTLPLFDFITIYGAMYLLVQYWEHTIKYVDGGKYPALLMNAFVPLYIILWIIGLFFSRGYQKPYISRKIIAGTIVGTGLISIMYAFLDDQYRFSRAIIILGAVVAIIGFVVNRVIYNIARYKTPFERQKPQKCILIIGSANEAERVTAILNKTEIDFSIAGIVNPDKSNEDHENYIGSITELDKLVSIYNADEIIFCAHNLSFQSIITWMQKLEAKADFKIVPDNSIFIIGSNSKNEPGDYYIFDEQYAITKKEHRLNKRTADIGFSIGLLIFFPVFVWFFKKPLTMFRNIVAVMSGKSSWVGYSRPVTARQSGYPEIKPGVLNPSDELPVKVSDDYTLHRLDYLYARDYSVYRDISIIWKRFSRIGRLNTDA